ncbi:Pentapeptide repeats containing protein [Halomicronema hongdechloris C2206]|uniref:Pentapeptide repeats containing protein n=1 Tax=Halomicronema hongdechloris C2206 TaxID=1641165 RepID=A0A1Z3HG37_9CYAN|nr:pentapeptide repeat-containing protein [Halomicronema hongdechloris]ASC69187.1 Pentapeptide repeats containing protein [Halomicronema hongdechloris C2206]
MSRNALIVGINPYHHLTSLKAPATDAEAIAQRLEQDGDFKVTRLPERIQPGDVNQPVMAETQTITQTQLEQALKQLFLPKSTQLPETALFYFSGHGIADEEGFYKGYLATSDTHPDRPRSGLSLRWLQWLLSESPIPQQIIWLDCCHSGSIIVDVGAANPGNSASRDRCFIASSRDFERSWEDLNSPYSTLTKALLDGLDPTKSPGRWVNTADLVAHVHQALTGELQTPVCTNFGEAINLTRSWQVPVERAEGAIATDICPYKGLEFFDCNDEDPKYFFGREQLVSQLLDHVRTRPFLALVGASGNGKSSVLRAGLLHQLKLGRRIAGSDQWRICLTRPDRQPMKNLALAFVEEGLSDLDRAEALGKAEGLLGEGSAGLQRLVQASSAPGVILVIDQFEEVFTRCQNPAEREQFFACLMGAVADTTDKLCVVIAMRADFVGKMPGAHEYSGLAQQVQTHMVSVLPLKPEELEAAICKPAEQVNLSVEPALVTEILNDIDGAPGSLPLLQYTLKALWQQRQGNTLQLATYQALGGISGTLDKRATKVYESFDPDQQRTVQHVFQQLTQLGEGTEDTRRRVFLDNLIAEPLHPADRVKTVIETLTDPDNRLLVTSEVVGKGQAAERRAIVDVAHEALIRHWRLLRQWIEQNRDLLRQQRRIEASAVTWQEREKAKGYLLQGLPLIEAMQFQKRRADTFPLSDAAKAFIQKSRQQRNWDRLKTASWLIIPALVLIPVVEHSLRQSRIEANLDRITEQEGTIAERRALQELVAGCAEQRSMNWLPTYITERLFGNCHPLWEAPLENANLSNADLSYADLITADLSGASLMNTDLSYVELSGANLSSVDLSDADLSDANLIAADLRYAFLSNTDLSDADLGAANLSEAIFFGLDLQAAQHLSVDQLQGENPPYLCNASLPTDIQIDKDRDCDQLPQVFVDRGWFNNLEEAKALVEELRQKTWD